MKINPTSDRVIVEEIKKAQTEGGIYLPDQIDHGPQKARVLAVGPGRRNKEGEHLPMAVEEGDIIYVGLYSGDEVEVELEDYRIVRERDILCIVDDA